MKKIQDLRVTLVQAPLSWEDCEGNLKYFSATLKKIRKGSTHLILLPEMFNTGFTMNTGSCAETMSGETVRWMQSQAVSKNAAICGSLIIKSGSKFFNRLVWAQPDGKLFHYDKRHLFRMANEHRYFSSGDKKLIVEWKGWKICPMVCYDLRFPVWSRGVKAYDLLLYVANWPERRRFAWKHLLIARAIENQCYVAGLNRVGTDGKQISYSGDSVILNALGEEISNIKQVKASVQTITLKYEKLNAFRKAFPVHMDADEFRITKS